jgi:hypothetical protein
MAPAATNLPLSLLLLLLLLPPLLHWPHVSFFSAGVMFPPAILEAL